MYTGVWVSLKMYVSVNLVFVCVCVCERERERDSIQRSSEALSEVLCVAEVMCVSKSVAAVCSWV